MTAPAAGTRVVTLFGGAGIRAGDTPVRGRATHRHALALLAYLIVNGGRGVTRDKLIALLWPERDTDSGRNLLKVNVHELRKELGDAAIRSIGDQLSVSPDALCSDVYDFLAAIARGDDESAVRLYTGPFLDGFFVKDSSEFEQWAETERARFAGMLSAALDRLASTAETRGDLEAAVRWRRAQAAHEPYHEDVAHRLVQALAASGDRAAAIQFAEAFVERRRRDLDIDEGRDIVTVARQLENSYAPPTTRFTPSASDAFAPRNDDPTIPAAPPPVRSTSRGAWIAAISLVAIVGAAVLGARALRARAAAPAIGPARTAVMPFRSFVADTSLRDGFRDLLAARFNDEEGSRIDAASVGRELAKASMNGAPSVDDLLAIARRVGATRLVAGEIAGASDSVNVTARLYDAVSGRVIATAHDAASRSGSITGIADHVFIELDARAAGEPEDRIAGLTRRPLIAARKYLAAQRAYKSARYAAAESLYAEALNADSTFGAAGLGLAMANSWTVINEHYGQGRDAAMHHLAAMGDRDREFALAFFGPDPALGPPQPAPVYLKRWEDLVEKYPDWTEAWYQLGDRYYHYGALSGLADPLDRARDAFRHAIGQDSAFAAPLHHLVELYAARREVDNLRDAGERYFEANPGVNRDRSAIGWEIAFALNDASWLNRIRANFDSMPREELTRIAWATDENGWPRDDAERAAGIVDQKSGTASEHERAAVLRFALGLNHNDAKEARAATTALGAQFPDRPVGALWDLFASMFATHDSALALDAVRRLDGFARAPVSGDHVRRDQQHLALCMVGLYRVEHGDVAAGRSAADRLAADLRPEDNNFAKRNGDVCLSMLAATIATVTHSADARVSVARLDTILLRERVPPHVVLEAGTITAANIHLALGDTAAALVAARRREHLTGDPIFLAVERELQKKLAARR